MESEMYDYKAYDFKEHDGLIRGSTETIANIAQFLSKHKIPYVIIPDGYFKGIKLTRYDYYRYIQLENTK